MGLWPLMVPPSAALSPERSMARSARHRPLMGPWPLMVPPSAALMRRAALALGVTALLVVGLVRPAPASADSGYRPPVAAPVADPFRPPSDKWGPGNRGLDYATPPGTEVRAAADGQVVFAGQVGGTLHVVVLHADGIRTSYSFLSAVRVQRGDSVRQGQAVGVTGSQPFHFGARAGEAYIDPALLFATGPPEVHLVPDSERRPKSEARERSGLLGMLAGLPGRAAGVAGGALGATGEALDWAAGRGADAGAWAAGAVADAGRWTADTTGAAGTAALAMLARRAAANLDSFRALAQQCWYQFPPVRAYTLARAVAGLFDGGDCTPSDVPAPPLRERHLVVLVGGLGSSGAATGGGAAIFGVDTAALGYAPGDVFRFSYRGGTAAEHPYGKADTEVDIRDSGQRLRALLERLRFEHPGVPVDILAHSQGGLVTRAALGGGYDRTDPRLPPLGAIVTMGTPHHGTDGATAVATVRGTIAGDLLLAGVHEAAPGFDDPRAVSIAQMSEGSDFIKKLNERPVPDGVFFTSIGAREDWLVPAIHTRVAGAHNVVVGVPSPTAHDALPSSPAARRETALALNHMPPTCRSLLDGFVDTVVTEGVHRTVHGATGALTIGSGGMP